MQAGGEADAGLWAEEVDIQCHDKCDATDDVISPDQTQPHMVTTDRRCRVQPRRKGGNIKTDQSNIITKKQELQISRRKISQLIYLLVDFCSWFYLDDCMIAVLSSSFAAQSALSAPLSLLTPGPGGYLQTICGYLQCQCSFAS